MYLKYSAFDASGNKLNISNQISKIFDIRHSNSTIIVLLLISNIERTPNVRYLNLKYLIARQICIQYLNFRIGYLQFELEFQSYIELINHQIFELSNSFAQPSLISAIICTYLYPFILLNDGRY